MGCGFFDYSVTMNKREPVNNYIFAPLAKLI